MSDENIEIVRRGFEAALAGPEQDFATMNALFDQYAKLTPADVQRAAAKYLVEKNRTIATLTGPGGAK